MGGSSGGGQSTPYEAPNTLSSAQSIRIIDVVSEGVIEGFAKGNQAPLKSVFFDDTPVQNADGTFNFQGVSCYFQRGTPDQTYIPGFDVSERTVAVSAQVKKATPIVRAVNDPLVSSLRITLGVERNSQVKDNGDTVPARTAVRIELVGSGNNIIGQRVEFSEKSSGMYYEDVLFEKLPPVPFSIRVTRETADSNSDRINNKTYFASYVEMVDAKLSYPNTALVALVIDSEQFGNHIPRRNYLVRGKEVQVPASYKPDTRQYAGGVWDGSFKMAATSNPAWIFYDVLTSPRYSDLARRLNAADIDKWSLYQIAKYCDELVDDGFGGKEPRFECHAYVSDEHQAGEFLASLASVFTGMPVWNGNQVSVVMDANADPVAQYTNSNVVDGLFTYSGAAYKAIHTAIHVQYVDKTDGWRTKTEYVADDEAIARYGLNVKSVQAFGCYSRGQAARFGAWMLQTELRQQNTVSFEVGREGLKHLPNDIVQIVDNHYAGAELSGRAVSVSPNTVVVDRDVGNVAGNLLYYTVSDGLKSVKVTAARGRTLTLERMIPLMAGDTWVLSGKIKPRLYRIIGIKENTDKGTFTVSALLHDPSKYKAVDTWANFDRQINTLHTLQPVLLNPSLSAANGAAVVTWDNLTAGGGALSYDVKIYRNGQLFRHITDAKTAEVRLENLPNGDYVAEIRGRNARGALSEPIKQAWSVNYELTAVRATARTFAIQLDWQWPQLVTGAAHTEIWYAKTQNQATAVKLAAVPYPQNTYTLSGVGLSEEFYFWLRMVDARGNSGQFTAMVKGQADKDPAPIVAQLQGAITKSALSKALLEQLQGDMAAAADDAVADEAAARVAAVKAAVDKAAADLLSKSGELGMRISAAEDVNKSQAQRIDAVTAAQGRAAAGLEAERAARVAGDLAEARARETLATRVGGAESNIASVRKSIADSNAARVEEVGRLQAKFDGLSVGGRNLVRNSAESRLHGYLRRYQITEPPKVGDVVTVTVWGSLGNSRSGQIGVFNSTGYGELFKLRKVADGVYRGSGVWKHHTALDGRAQDTHLNLYAYPSTDNTENNRFDKVKFERGNIHSDWSPAPEDGDAVTLAELSAFKEAQASARQADARRIDSAVARVAGAEAKITAVQQVAAGLDGKVQSLYTLKAETVAGGRKAVSALMLGADGATADSQILLMADKVAFVQPNTKQIVPMMSVSGNGMAVNGDLVADGTILGRHIAAYTDLRAPVIHGGVINAAQMNSGHLNGGSINIGNGNFTVDSAGNLVANSGRFNGTIYADKIDGDVLRMIKMQHSSEGVYQLNIQGGRTGFNASLMNLSFITPDWNGTSWGQEFLQLRIYANSRKVFDKEFHSSLQSYTGSTGAGQMIGSYKGSFYSVPWVFDVQPWAAVDLRIEFFLRKPKLVNEWIPKNFEVVPSVFLTRL